MYLSEVVLYVFVNSDEAKRERKWSHQCHTLRSTCFSYLSRWLVLCSALCLTREETALNSRGWKSNIQSCKRNKDFSALFPQASEAQVHYTTKSELAWEELTWPKKISRNFLKHHHTNSRYQHLVVVTYFRCLPNLFLVNLTLKDRLHIFKDSLSPFSHH